MPLLRQSPDTVFDDDHGGIHDEAEIDCTKAHQIGRDTEVPHSDNGHEHGQRNCRGHNQASTDLKEKEEENCHNHEAALDEIPAGGANGAVHKCAAVVERVYSHTGRQSLLHLLKPIRDTLSYGSAVFAFQHHGDSHDRLAFAITRRRALADLCAPTDLGDGTDIHRRPLV